VITFIAIATVPLVIAPLALGLLLLRGKHPI
jgi:hypothetical protein